MATVTEVWADTGEVIEREPTAEEKAQAKLDAKAAKEVEKAVLDAEAKRQATVAKLLDLGLTPDDLRTLGLA